MIGAYRYNRINLKDGRNSFVLYRRIVRALAGRDCENACTEDIFEK